MNKKQAKQKADVVNGIIHSRNLYARAAVTGANDRVINARATTIGGQNGIWTVVVESLHTGHIYFVAETKFQDGYGQEVLL